MTNPQIESAAAAVGQVVAEIHSALGRLIAASDEAAQELRALAERRDAR